MRAVVQRVARARVEVAEELVGEISAGLLIYLGVAPSDTAEVAQYLAQRLARMRIFPDPEGRMNRSLLDCGGAALVVSQFTLFADNRRGHRPSFAQAGAADLGRELCQRFSQELSRLGVPLVESGRFAAHMVVESRNDGPVTIVASSGEPGWEVDCG